MRLLIARYRSSPEMGWGRFELIRHRTRSVMVHSLRDEEGRMIAIHNFSDEPATVRFTIDDIGDGCRLVDLLVDGRVIDAGADGGVEIALDGYGHRWLRVLEPGSLRLG
ncbi:hypothetical protein GCM10025881_08040 [Pseudolysinimonas kribbensis]|uniref:Sucrose hydrolase-like C-terminal domain-containing protein n=1 Tax=Pseudolysinimonas kribbensis TaxID=433641 RepID=A0ABQ6K337_9MICO|nr:hypothetical protein GCM10025881_08040 [Pseudolysinimonas kribbensis]